VTAADYSTTAGGKSYAATVEESDGEYTASVPGLAGATATGSSIVSAEMNLTTRVDELV
jgi:predicted RNase H-like HicB family nuclease